MDQNRTLNAGNTAWGDLVISHDHWLLDRVPTHVLAFEGNSEVVWFEGDFQAHIEDLKKREGPDADEPHRIAYKKLVRA